MKNLNFLILFYFFNVRCLHRFHGRVDGDMSQRGCSNCEILKTATGDGAIHLAAYF